MSIWARDAYYRLQDAVGPYWRALDRWIDEKFGGEVDNAVAALTSMLEPIMIVFLAVIVGTIVLALFTPLISIITGLQQQT